MRVYDEKGRFDETQAKPLSLIDSETIERVQTVHNSREIGYSIDRTALRNILVKGASVTVYGKHISETDGVIVDGQIVPIDSHGKFIRQMILPFGDQTINVEVSGAAQTVNYSRDVHLKDTDFFYVSIGDVTLGTSNSVGTADFLGKGDQDFSDVSVYGRGAAYVLSLIHI